MHDVQPDVAVVRMQKALRHRPDHLEAERAPERHRTGVGLDDGVELDRAEAVLPRPVEDVLAERPPDPLPTAPGSTMKLAVATCAAGPPWFGCIFAVPTTVPSAATAITVRPGGSSIHSPRASSSSGSRS